MNLCKKDSSKGSKTCKGKGPADRTSSSGEWSGVRWLRHNWRHSTAGTVSASGGVHSNCLGSWNASRVCDDSCAICRSHAWVWRCAGVGRVDARNGADGRSNGDHRGVNLGRLSRAVGNRGSTAGNCIVGGGVDRRSSVGLASGIHNWGITRRLRGRAVGILRRARGHSIILSRVDSGVIVTLGQSQRSTSEKGDGNGGETHLDG